MEEIIQGSESWFAARLGKITASKVEDVMKGPKLAGYRNYRAQLLCERLTGQREETYINAAMQRGTDLEPLARECYEFISGTTVEQIGFVNHPYIPNFGCSPDGLVGEDGLIEIKCPNSATHIDYILAGVVPTDYVKQMTSQLSCTGRKWVDFVSYDPRLPEEMQLFIIRMHRHIDAIEEMEKAVFAFDKEVNRMIDQLSEIAKR
jgi:putative phage-type endonuclease